MMRDKEEVRKEVERIPTRQEYVDECFDELQKARDGVDRVEEAYRWGHNDEALEQLISIEQDSCEKIRKLIGATRGVERSKVGQK